MPLLFHLYGLEAIAGWRQRPQLIDSGGGTGRSAGDFLSQQRVRTTWLKAATIAAPGHRAIPSRSMNRALFYLGSHDVAQSGHIVARSASDRSEVVMARFR